MTRLLMMAAFVAVLLGGCATSGGPLSCSMSDFRVCDAHHDCAPDYDAIHTCMQGGFWDCNTEPERWAISVDPTLGSCSNNITYGGDGRFHNNWKYTPFK